MTASTQFPSGTGNPLTGSAQVKTGDYTVVPTDVGSWIVVDSASDHTVTLPSAVPSGQFILGVINIGMGVVTVSRNGLTINGNAADLLLTHNQSATITTDGSNYFSPSSAPQGSPMYVPLTVPITDPTTGLTFTGPTFQARSMDLQPSRLTRFSDDFLSDVSFYTKYNAAAHQGTTTWADGTLVLGSGTSPWDIFLRTNDVIAVPQYACVLGMKILSASLGTYAVPAVGVGKDASNFVHAEWDVKASVARIAVDVAGTITYLGSVTLAYSAVPTQLAFVLCNNFAQVWVNKGSGWTYVTGADVSTYHNFTNPSVLATYFPEFGFGSDSGNTATLDYFTHGYYGQLGLRDMNVVTHKAGAPFVNEEGWMFFTSTATDIAGVCHVGIYRFNNTTGQLQKTGIIYVNRSSTLFNDLSAHLVYDDDLSLWRVFMGSWGNGFGGDLYLQTTTYGGDLLNGVTVLSGLTQLTGVTQYAGTSFAAYSSSTTYSSGQRVSYGGNAYQSKVSSNTGHQPDVSSTQWSKFGVYDQSIIFDVTTNRWYVGYVAVPDTTFPSSIMYACMDYTTDFVTFTNVLADSANAGYEGTKLQQVGGVGNLFLFTGSITNYRVYTKAGAYLGALNCPNPSNGNAPAHPMIYPVMVGQITKWRVMSFDGVKFGTANFTWGSLLWYDASQTETGFEFPYYASLPGPAGADGAAGPAGAGVINWLGAYNGGTTYAPNDAASYNGSSYICILGTTGNLPTNATYWNAIALEGSTGASGSTGATGSNGTNGTNGAYGGAVTFDFLFDTGTSNADPGSGKARLNNATQNTATALYVNTTTNDGNAVAGLLDTLDASTSTTKGRLRLFKKSDVTKFLYFTVSARTSHTGYREYTIVNVASSASSPFSASDELLVAYDFNGDAGSGGGGSVSSVGLTVPAEFSVSGSPVTGAGTLAVTKATQSANQVYAGPTTGSAAAPTFRALVAADIPVVSAAISFASATSPGTINLSSVGTKDWLTLNGLFPNPPRAQSGLTIHSKQLGGWLKYSFDWFNGGAGSPTLVTGGSTSIAITTTAGDDEAPALSGSTLNLSAIRSATGTPLNYGYRFEVPADATSRTLALNVAVNSVKVTITCRMSDASIADQTTTLDAVTSGTYVQKQISVTYNSSQAGAKMIVTVEVTTNYGGSFQDVGFACATVSPV